MPRAIRELKNNVSNRLNARHYDVRTTKQKRNKLLQKLVDNEDSSNNEKKGAKKGKTECKNKNKQLHELSHSSDSASTYEDEIEIPKCDSKLLKGVNRKKNNSSNVVRKTNECTVKPKRNQMMNATQKIKAIFNNKIETLEPKEKKNTNS